MRALALLPLGLLVGACWTPGPSPLERAYYRWDQPIADRLPLALPRPKGEYCVVALEPGGENGIVLGGRSATQLACAPGAAPAKPSPPRS